MLPTLANSMNESTLWMHLKVFVQMVTFPHSFILRGRHIDKFSHLAGKLFAAIILYLPQDAINVGSKISSSTIAFVPPVRTLRVQKSANRFACCSYSYHPAHVRTYCTMCNSIGGYGAVGTYMRITVIVDVPISTCAGHAAAVALSIKRVC